jgi:hypothetical protein
MSDVGIIAPRFPIEAKHGTILKHDEFIKVPREPPLSGLWSRKLRISFRYVTKGVARLVQIRQLTFKITAFLASSGHGDLRMVWGLGFIV